MSHTAPTLERHDFENHVILKRRSSAAEFADALYWRAFSYPNHYHKKSYFMLTDHCVYKERLGSKIFYHAPNTVLWRPPEICHSDGMEQTNGRSFSVFIKDGLIRKHADYASIPAEFSEKNSHLVFLANRLRQEFRSWTEGSGLIAEGLVLEMLGYTAKKRMPADKTPPKWLTRIVERLEDEYTQRHTNTELAGVVGIHPVHLARTFRKYYGRSVGTYLKEIRIHRAILLVMQKKLTLAEISYLSGFSDQSHFTRAFKDIVGITPGEFRRDALARKSAQQVE